jgi:hypothetical protein
MRQFTFIAAIVATVAILFIATKPASAAANPQSKGGASVAFARFLVGSSADNLGVTTFGGKGTVAINEFVSTPGSAEITFTGKYGKTLTTDQVVAMVSVETGDHGVGSAKVISASPTQIVIDVTTWNSTTGAAQTNAVNLTVFIGQTF